jgi:hypothetical protein
MRPGLDRARLAGSGGGKVIDKKPLKEILITIFVPIYLGGKEWQNLFR